MRCLFDKVIGAVPGIVLLIHVAVALHSEPAPIPRQVGEVRYWTAPDRTRVVLDMSGDSSYRIKILTSPHRLAINIPSGRFSSRVKPMAVKDGVLDGIRINKLSWGVQVVLDLPRGTRYRHFALRPYKHRPHRIVVDLFRERTSDELRMEREQAERIATSGDCVVIIDPGHGGSQPGAISRGGLKEKDVVLKVATMAAKELNRTKGFKAVLTRDGDYDVGLQRRIDIARSHGGHCYVSIHMNSVRSRSPSGSEVYFLSLKGASDENAQAVAERENLFLTMGEEGEEITDDLKSILFDLNRSNSMYLSSLLAGRIAAAMKKNEVLQFRGIKQANFVVLRSITMPSVLVELAFLSNSRDVKLLRKNETLQGLALSLAEGITSFLGEHPPQEEIKETEGIITHIVARGETLWGIARKYGVSVSKLRAVNGLEKSSRILPGQKLRVN